MLSNPTPTEEDRIALSRMFKAIAEYGRKVRLRRQAETGNAIGQESNHQNYLPNQNIIHVEKEEVTSN